MAATYEPSTTHDLTATLHRARTEPAYGAFLLMRIGYTVLPL